MPTPVRIALDIMGADLGPRAALDGARLALTQHPNLHLMLVGDEHELNQFVRTHEGLASRVTCVPSTTVVSMRDAPTDALRNGGDSSMRVAIDCVANGQAEACVSSGNTGALVAMSKLVLKTIEGLRRPALLTPIPSIDGVTIMLDVGANTKCKAQTLAEFAVMGSIVATTDYDIDSPRVGLLNIGVEAGKGHEVLNEADAMLRASSLNYVGFCEANNLFSSSIDVAVSDGFAGNIALKTMEGFSRFVASRAGSTSAGMAGLDPRAHNGASLVGLRHVVIKSHGGADAVALGHALDTAMTEARAHVPQKIAEGLARLR
ncbi:MAG: phosphate acyltransferase PlsX [Pseudomonadota bacterium]